MFSEKRIHTILKVLRCFRQFGVISGVRLLASMRSNQQNIQLRVPGYKGFLHLRTEVADISVFDKIFIQREYDLAIPLKDPKLIIDGGANIGFSTIFFAQKYPTARIIAIEPEKSNFELLVRNTQIYPQITPINAAIWPNKTSLDFTNTNYGKMAFQVKESLTNGHDNIKAMTISDLLKIAGTETVDLLKLDIECAEKDLFSAENTDWLDKVRIIVIELHDWIKPGNSLAFYRALCKYEFSQYLQGENVVIVKS